MPEPLRRALRISASGTLVAVACSSPPQADPDARTVDASTEPVLRADASAQPARAGPGNGRAPGLPAAYRATTFLAMGGVPIRLRGWAAETASLERALPLGQLFVEAMDATLSTHRADSALSRLNRSGPTPTPVRDGHLWHLIGASLAWSERTEGAFDPTVGPLVALWRRAAREHRRPDRDELATAIARVGRSHVHVDGALRTVALDEGSSLDLDAIAEGYMIDHIVAIMRAEGVERGYVEVGGDLRVYDDRPAPSPFRIGVRRPGAQDLLGTVELTSGALASAGCYERYFVVGGKRLCHVLDARTGEPVADTEGTTVLAPAAIDADALATAILVRGPRWALAELGASREVGAVVVAPGPSGETSTLVSGALGLAFERSAGPPSGP